MPVLGLGLEPDLVEERELWNVVEQSTKEKKKQETRDWITNYRKKIEHRTNEVWLKTKKRKEKRPSPVPNQPNQIRSNSITGSKEKKERGRKPSRSKVGGALDLP